MTLFRTVEPAAEPVTLADAKAHLRISHDSEDALLQGLIRAAREDLERAAGIALINTCASVGGFVGPYAIGFLRDRTGGGNAAGLVFLGVLLLLAAAATLLLRRARALAD